MSTPALEEALRGLQRAREVVEEAIKEAIAMEACRAGITEIRLMGWWGDEYWQGDTAAPINEEIELLRKLYCQAVSPAWLEGRWTEKSGWEEFPDLPDHEEDDCGNEGTWPP